MTAIEWLNEQLQEMDSKSFNNLIQIEMGRDNYNQIIEEAKEMEKEQIFKTSRYFFHELGGLTPTQYYNETFKNTNKCGQ